MTEALEQHQLGRDVLIAQPLIQLERIRRRVEYQAVYDRGVKVHSRYLTLFTLRNSLSVGRLGIAATRKLVAGYEKASSEYLSGLGFLYGTEVVDLQMVATIGALMKRCTGLRTLQWVDIHVQQEPGHVESSSQTLNQSLDHDAQQRVVTSAEEMWTLWTDFFKSIREEILPRITRMDADN